MNDPGPGLVALIQNCCPGPPLVPGLHVGRATSCNSEPRSLALSYRRHVRNLDTIKTEETIARKSNMLLAVNDTVF